MTLKWIKIFFSVTFFWSATACTVGVKTGVFKSGNEQIQINADSTFTYTRFGFPKSVQTPGKWRIDKANNKVLILSSTPKRIFLPMEVSEQKGNPAGRIKFIFDHLIPVEDTIDTWMVVVVNHSVRIPVTRNEIELPNDLEKIEEFSISYYECSPKRIIGQIVPESVRWLSTINYKVADPMSHIFQVKAPQINFDMFLYTDFYDVPLLIKKSGYVWRNYSKTFSSYSPPGK